MKSISNMLGRGNLTPRERALILIQDDLTERMGGTSCLTQADIESLQNFKNSGGKYGNFGIQDYNEIMRIWRMIDNIMLDSQTAFMNMNIEYLRLHRLFTMLFYGAQKESEHITKTLLKDYVPKGLLLLLKNSGLDYKRTIYNLAYSNLDPVTQQDSLLLYPDAKTEHHYFLSELFLAKYYSDKKTEISEQEKVEIINEILKSFSWDYLEKMNVLKHDGLWQSFFNGYFAEVPHMEIIQRCAKYSNMHSKDEDTLRDIFIGMLKNNEVQAVKNIIRTGMSKWLDDGLFTQEYVPLCLSKRKETCNGSDTTKSHKEIMKEWQEKYAEAENIINGLVESKKLNIVVKTKKIHTFTFEETIITGESIFELDDTYIFAKEYRNQVENLMPAAVAISTVKNGIFLDWYTELSEVKKLLTGISRFIELDITPMVQKHIEGMNDELDIVNRQIDFIFEKYEDYSKFDTNFLIQYYPENMKVELYDNKTTRLGIAKIYLENSKTVSPECHKLLSSFFEEKQLELE